MAYESGFNEDPVIELKFLVEVVGEDRDEVDSVSKQVIDLKDASPLPRYIVHKSYFPQKEAPLEFHGREERTKRLKKVNKLVFLFYVFLLIEADHRRVSTCRINLFAVFHKLLIYEMLFNSSFPVLL